MYDLQVAGDWHVWDIGLNIGIAALFFAQEKVWTVDGFELFPQTAEAAAQNVANSGLTDRIAIFPYGVGGRNAEFTLDYHAGTRGSNGLFGNHAEERADDAVPTQVTVRDASEVAQEVIERAQGKPVLAKIDCEGAEYEIIERLAETGQLRALDAILMETHFFESSHQVDRLIHPLIEAGFAVKHSRKGTQHVGFLTAVRRS